LTANVTCVAENHPAFGPYSRWLEAACFTAIPACSTLDAFARAAGLALPGGTRVGFVAASGRRVSALDYERRIARTGEVAVRSSSLHDFCNALAWLAFPRTKAALNAVHVAARPSPAAGSRAPARDAATLLDESGLLVACADPEIMRAWEAREWRVAFGDIGTAGAPRLHAVAVGHGLLAKCITPYRAITAHALVLPIAAGRLPDEPGALAAALDAAASRQIAQAGDAWSPESLLPLPVAGLPGWDRERLGARLFDDVSVFRPRTLRHCAPPGMRAGAVMLR
jgi:hypothetical protein